MQRSVSKHGPHVTADRSDVRSTKNLDPCWTEKRCTCGKQMRTLRASPLSPPYAAIVAVSGGSRHDAAKNLRGLSDQYTKLSLIHI